MGIYKRFWSEATLKIALSWIAKGAASLLDALKRIGEWLKTFPASMKADWDIITSLATKGMEGLKTAFTGFFDWLKEKINWLGSFVPGWTNISGRAGDIPGMAEHLRGGGGSAGALSAGERGQYADIIKKVAAQEGVDPNALLKIYGTEGGSAWMGDVNDPRGPSYGPFQLNTSGLLRQYHGSHEKSAQAVEDMTRFVARYGKQHGGWSSSIWHGLRDKGIGSIPYRKMSENAVPPAGGTHVHLHTKTILDGRIISASVERHLVKKHEFVHSSADHDDRAGYPAIDSMSIA